MNEWVSRSIRFANESDYLDKLWEVYPLEIGAERPLSPARIAEIAAAHQSKDAVSLVKALLTAPRFPVDHPFAAMMRGTNGDRLVARNPETLRKIGEPLLRMELQKILGLCMKPIAPNATMGPMFKKWLKAQGFVLLPPDEFGRVPSESGQPVVFLDGPSDEELKSYANEHFNSGLGRGIDLVFRVGGEHFIGEAKWLGATGGKQTTTFHQAMDFLGGHTGKARRVLVMDGVMWLNGGNEMQVQTRNCESNMMSALLLKEFIESVRQTQASRN